VDLSWLPDTLRTLAVGAVGGIAAYLLAQRRFVSERIWDKRYEIYSEIFDSLNQLEHSLTTLDGALGATQTAEQGSDTVEAARSFEAGLLKINQLQERLLLLSATTAHIKLMTLYAALSVFHPFAMVVTPSSDQSQVSEIRNLISSSRRIVTGRNGEIAFLARVKTAARRRLPFSSFMLSVQAS
jgi:hypothetical protein